MNCFVASVHTFGYRMHESVTRGHWVESIIEPKQGSMTLQGEAIHYHIFTKINKCTALAKLLSHTVHLLFKVMIVFSLTQCYSQAKLHPLFDARGFRFFVFSHKNPFTVISETSSGNS